MEPLNIETSTVGHYEVGDLLAAIEAGVKLSGKSPATISVAELGSVDEFHVGGREVTAGLCQRLGVSSSDRVLDIGSGIGGTARFLATTTGCQVTGLDLTPEYVETASKLTQWVGLTDQVEFATGSALAMEFEDGTFDAVSQLHVGMNIADKQTLFAEVSRVLIPRGRFLVYDILRTSEGEVTFPVPWASETSVSFVEDLACYRSGLVGAGFRVKMEQDHRQTALDFFAEARERASQEGGPAPLGIHLLLGDDAFLKLGNLGAAVVAGVLTPTEIICVK